MGLLISQELDTHLEILEDTDHRIDYTETRLGNADRNLKRLLKKAKTNSKPHINLTRHRKNNINNDCVKYFDVSVGNW